MAVSDELNRFLEALRSGAATLDVATVEAIDRDYPFFTLADAELLRQDGAVTDPEERRRFAARLALNSSDPDTFFRLVDRDHATWATFYPPEDDGRSVSTDDAITTFLDTYGHSDPAQDALLERLIFNPVPDDYMSLLEKEGTPAPADEPLEHPDAQDVMIDSFLHRAETHHETPAPAAPVPVQAPEPSVAPPRADAVTPAEEPVEMPPPYRPRRRQPAEPDNTSLSESLAKIYIKQRRYDKAYEIIHSLSLKNPKKSVYFADQLRFLRKLIINQQHQK